MRFVTITIIALFLAASVSQLSFAEEARALKIAYVDASVIFDNYYKTKEADEKLEKEGSAKNEEREKYVKEINKLKDEAALLNTAARKEKEEELGEKIRKLQDFDREVKTNLQRKRNDLLKDIFEEIDEKIIAYGKKNGYDLILDSRVLLFADDSLNVNSDIIKALNGKE